MPTVGASTMFFHEYQVDTIFDALTDAGCDAVEFWLETPSFWLNDLPSAVLLDAIHTHSAIHSVSVHAPVLDLNPCSVNPDVAEVSIRWACRAVSIARQIDACAVTIHPGRRTAKRPASFADRKRLAHYLSEVKTCAASAGIPVALENMEQKVNSLLPAPSDLISLLEKEKWLYFTLDIAHTFTGNNRDAAKYIEHLGNRIAVVHVSARINGRMHCTVKGNDDVANILTLLAENGYSGPLILEIEDLTFQPELSLSKKIEIVSDETSWIRNFFE
ncbi:sugar phosphate isomerase/epimerase [Methanogenium sp. S4BF]|uniref:sugar phosphate isomerase/epimerase family protein n=1 Tax=Methanogenium sp. S4BF TaxID=1789226 RepID=UPI00241753EA|nr:sugar phosphate isomerase/epimerase family protein [Methanogenium sp. S4BF]WFN34744.1 sugar phosphate isomerase/epimerase [Methanogenium sp. S4BF]